MIMKQETLNKAIESTLETLKKEEHTYSKFIENVFVDSLKEKRESIKDEFERLNDDPLSQLGL